MKEIEIQHHMEQSTPIVTVPLSNSNKPAVIFQDDWDMLMAMGLTPRWKLHNSHVVEQSTHLNIARLIVDAKKDQLVRLLDGSPLNLKRPNLGLARGGNGKYDAKEKLRNTKRPVYNTGTKLTHHYINPPEMKEITQ